MCDLFKMGAGRACEKGLKFSTKEEASKRWNKERERDVKPSGHP